MNDLSMWIGGRPVEAASGDRFPTFDPFAGEPWATVPDAGPADVGLAVAAAHDALEGEWAALTGGERGRLLGALADVIERRAEELAEIETRDNGKLLREMQGQMTYLPAWYRFFGGAADKLDGRAIAGDRPGMLAYTRREPIGVVAAIVPWNSPLLLLAWKLAPALAAGCTVVAKPSDQAPASTLRFAELTAEAGFPPGVFNVVTGSGAPPGEALVSHPDVDKVAFTGSTEVGIAVARAAADSVTPCTLELGGKSAQVVFADADLEAAANGLIAGVFAATGQTCLAGARLVVHADVHDALLERLVRRAETIRLGDPRDPGSEMGPLTNRRQLERVLGLVESARDEGATVACGGKVDPELGGFFMQPTVLTDVRPEMAAVREEIFGPVLVVSRFETEDEAVALANDTRFGLAAGVWTKDVHRAHRVAHRLAAGTVWVNAYRVVSPTVPFGGYGLSGIGRENGIEAVDEYLQTKAIWVELTGSTRDPFVMG
jgi:aldehyde dehydrogenase (NAD+)